MKVEKKLIALLLCMLMMATTILSPVYSENEVRAAETTGTEETTAKKILFNERLMTGSNTSFPFLSSSGHCMTNAYQIVISAGHTNVISYCAPSDGFVRVSNINVLFNSSNHATISNREFEFAITDENGKILSNNGAVLVVDSIDNQVLSTVQHEIKKGERLHFVFHANKGTTNLTLFKSKIEFSLDGSDNSWETVNNESASAPWPVNVGVTTVLEQGQGDFYYQYSEVYKTVGYKEEVKKISVNAREMSNAITNFPFVYDSTYCKTNSFQIIVSAGYTNVIAYQAEADGMICIDTLKVWEETADTGRQFEFAVINEEGKILSNNGQVYTADSGLKQDGAKDLVVTNQPIKQGERIYFVFHGVIGNIQLLRCQATILFCEEGETSWTTVNASTKTMSLQASTANNDNMVQGLGNFYYQYSKVYKTEKYAKNANMISVNKIEMSNAITNFPFVYDSTYCKTNSFQIIVSAGYTNVIAYQAEADGMICIDTLKVWEETADTGRQFEFAVINEEGKILSNNGQVYTADSGLKQDGAKDLVVTNQPIKQGERIYFVFHGVIGNIQLLRCQATILFCEEGETSWTTVNASTKTMSLQASTANNDNMVQGLGNFYYLYSERDTTDVGKLGKKVGTEAEGIVTIYGTPEKGTTYCDKYITDVAGDGTVSYIDLDMLNIKKQSKINEDMETIDVRYIASVDNLSYKKVGFVFSLASSEPTVGGAKCADIPLTKVYKRLLEDKGYRKAENLYAEDGCSTTYAFAFEMLQTPPDVTVYARAYVQLNDNTIVYGTPRAVTTTATGTVK